MSRKHIFRSGSLPFVLFAVLTAALTAAIILLNTFSSLQSRLVLAEAQKNSSELSSGLYEIEKHFIQSAEAMVHYLPYSAEPRSDEAYLKQLASSINAVATDFSTQRDIVLGYYYDIDAKYSAEYLETFHNVETDTQSHISMILGYLTDGELAEIESEISQTGYPVWLTVNQPMYNKYYLSCIAPLFANGEYIGFAGVLIDSSVLKEQYTDMLTDEWRYSFLLTENNEIFAHDSYSGGERLEYVDFKYLTPLAEAIKLSDSGHAVIEKPGGAGVWIYAYDRMPSGHIYVEAQQRAHRVTETNLLLLQMAMMAILATALVSRWRSGSDSAFDILSKKLIRQSGDVHPLATSADRATLALHVGCLGGVGFRLLFLILSGGAVWQIVLYAIVLAVLLMALWLFNFRELGNIPLIIISATAIVLPVLLQLLVNAPGEVISGSSLIWILISAVGALFLFDRDKARSVFYIYVIALFVYTLIEIFFKDYPRPEVLLPLIGSLIFLGFAFFSSVDIYVQNAKSNYDILEHTHKELKDAQSMLVQREKMVTLGQLVAGIAHEINTPLGAIKATADTLSATMERVFKALMEQSIGFSDEDRSNFIKLTGMVSASIRQMNTTSQIRKARGEIRNFAKSRIPENGDTIAELLIRLELCDMELLEENIEILSDPKAVQMLKLICDISPFIFGSQTIELAAAKAGKIVFALKSYSHSGVLGEGAPVDVAQSIETVLILYQNQLKQSIQVVKDFDMQLPKIFAVVDEIGQVWTNIIHNAIQAMPGGGMLTITLLNTNDGFVEARFSDTGIGIQRENLEKIFEPFFTTKQAGEGTGLGLDISNKIILRHGGVINVQSEPGAGTVFIVRLPADKTGSGVTET